MVAIGLYLLSGRSGDVDAEQKAPPAGSRDETSFLVDADSSGAIVMTSKEFVGYRRAGETAEVAWRKPLDEIASYAQFACGAACPSLVASGGSGAGQAEPAPYVVGDSGVPPEWLEPTGGLNTIVAVDRAGSARLVSDGPSAPSWWEMVSSDGRRTRVEAGGSGLVLFPRVSDRAVVVARTTTDEGQPTTHVLRRGVTGWTVAMQTDKRVATCVSADGVTEVEGASIRSGGRSWTIAAADEFSSCWLTREAVVLSQNVSSASGPATTVAVVDLEGKELTKITVDDEVAVAASTVANLIALTATTRREVKILDGGGRPVGSLDGYGAAQFDELGDLCVLDQDGAPRWFAPDRLSR